MRKSDPKERWLAEREQYAAILQSRARGLGRARWQEAWERYVRKTAIMKGTAQTLEAALGRSHGLAHGLRVIHKRRELYLEHVVIGAGGVILLEHVEAHDEHWAQDLERNIEFFREVLGTHSHRFLCIVIPVSFEVTVLPEGAVTMDSVEMACVAIRERGWEDPLPSSVAQSIWHLLQARASTRPVRVRDSLWSRFSLELVSMVLSLMVGLALSIDSGEDIGYGMPILLIWGLTLLPYRTVLRKPVQMIYIIFLSLALMGFYTSLTET
ncbi:MAG: hypothetical protein ACOY93_11470 [Bacillota bacterium]